MQKKQSLNFPKKFLWGAALGAAHQIEGGTHNQWTAWELENAKSRAAQSKFHLEDLEKWEDIRVEAEDPANYVSDKGVDHKGRYRDDFSLAKGLNLNAIKFSVEWSRIEPQEGAWNVAAVTHYKTYLEELVRHGFEPILTLFHFTLPVWFAEKGGFERRSNIQYFVRFAEKITQELGREIRFVLTLHEPETYAYESYYMGVWPPNVTSKTKFRRVLKNLARAHNQVADKLHGVSRRYKVSIAKNSAYYYAGDDAWLSRKSADIMQYLHDDYFLKKIVKKCDFIGANFYSSHRVYGYRVHNPEQKLSDTGADLSPADIQHAVERLYEKYKLPIIITENGLADAGDEHRKWWLGVTLMALQKALQNGVEIGGYFYRSLTDGFEWDHGIWPRFGLAKVDYTTLERTPRPSALWYGDIVKKIRKISE